MTEDLGTKLANIEERTVVVFTVNGERIEGQARHKADGNGRVHVLVVARAGLRIFSIETQWANGWLEPLVDVADLTENEPTFEPMGTLQDLNTSVVS